MGRGGLWVSSRAWCEKGMVRKLCKNALRVFREIKETACVHRFCLAKPLGPTDLLFESAVSIYIPYWKMHGT